MGLASRGALAAALGLALAGCGGGSDGGDDDGPRPTFAELEAEGTALQEEIDALEITDPSELPTEGSASYEGVIGIESAFAQDDEGPDSGLPSMGGELSLEVDFEDSSLSGTAENFVTEAGEEMEGSLDIEDGQVYRDAEVGTEDEEPSFGAVVTGRLEDEDGGAYEFGGGLAGEFRGSSHSHVQGEVGGTVLTPDGVEAFEGGFVAER